MHIDCTVDQISQLLFRIKKTGFKSVLFALSKIVILIDVARPASSRYPLSHFPQVTDR